MGILREYLFPNMYHYHDTPEGEDCGKKLWCITHNFAIYGVMGSSMDVLLYSHPKGYGPTIARYAYITLPFVGMGATFAVTSCMATILRKKDDVWNYFIGGYAAGAVWGAWKKSYRIGVYGGLALALFLTVHKHCLENGWEQFTSRTWMPQKNGNVWSVHRDYSIVKDPGRTWKISPDEEMHSE